MSPGLMQALREGKEWGIITDSLEEAQKIAVMLIEFRVEFKVTY